MIVERFSNGATRYTLDNGIKIHIGAASRHFNDTPYHSAWIDYIHRPGCSWVEVVSGDHSTVETAFQAAMCELISARLKGGDR